MSPVINDSLFIFQANHFKKMIGYFILFNYYNNIFNIHEHICP